MKQTNGCRHIDMVVHFYEQNYDRLKAYFIAYCHDKMPKKRASIYKTWREDTMTARRIAEDMHLSVRTVECHIYHATKGIKAFLSKAM